MADGPTSPTVIGQITVVAAAEVTRADGALPEGEEEGDES